ncbi:MBL fold metallo-hydrolase [Ectothiorhodospiraceae bacterium BW-2]|nr:MBL fold metallo-hydrolase [Ectothiorhodospiraceae bacterium BW-2]
MYTIHHHGAINGVTGSCHQLRLQDGRSLLIDCGLFQGAEAADSGAAADRLAIEFPLDDIQALIVTHTHIDHVGRIPYLLAAGFNQPIYCSHATAKLLPLVLEDALKVGVTRNERLIKQAIGKIEALIVPLGYKQWHTIAKGWQIKLHPAGHILGSAYVEIKLSDGLAPNSADGRWHILFSGDLGAPYTPLLPAPKSPWRADDVILESTYGDRTHSGRAARVKQLRSIVERAMRDRGTVIIPAFSIGRTQELLYEFESILHRYGQQPVADGIDWSELDIIIDSPLAAKMTRAYRELRDEWDAEAKQRLARGRHPLAFDTLLTVEEHAAHLRIIDYLKRSGRPAIVIAASGMCAGGRVVNYLKALLDDSRTDILFVGYQAAGTPGQIIQKYGPRGGYVDLDGQRITIRAQIHTLSGYSAHADQNDLLKFVKRIRKGPQRIRLVHGDATAKRTLAKKLSETMQGVVVE